MVSMLPDEPLLEKFNSEFPCRELQIRQLICLFTPNTPNPSSLVVHGLEATGKSIIVKNVLSAVGTDHAIVRSQECVTVRHLLERTIAACGDAISSAPGDGLDRGIGGRCENVSALAVQLQLLLAGATQKLVLVFDGVDRQREAPPTLLPALARLGELIPNLCVVFIVTAPRQRFLSAVGVPHIYFTPYTKDQSIRILSKHPCPIFPNGLPELDSDEDPEGYTEEQAQEDSLWVWTRFCSAVWDSLSRGAARDIVTFRALAEKLWRPFVQPIVDGTYGTRDFSKLMVLKRPLFQTEKWLVQGIVERVEEGVALNHTHDLAYYSKYLLCAAYLASYNPARQDSIYFMKGSEKKRKRRGGGGASGRVAKHRKIQRKLLGPQAFVMERMLAIFRAILPHDIVTTADIYTQTPQIATLTSLRLLVRTSNTADVLEAQTKWRVNIGWEYVRQLARSVGFEIESHIAE
ncbi:hypothetical protein FGG08_006141 [Glutinoglossum americanum]|uniref:Origin recognition complex subunit 5 n=1 Tax=Glutinoglossum americanum TaxID=1670608 RepID=A0A9P8HWQ4_9PEZI|nr:hypothetical protein FGG08_006141 [Glutinoglossum americanum]